MKRLILTAMAFALPLIAVTPALANDTTGSSTKAPAVKCQQKKECKMQNKKAAKIKKAKKISSKKTARVIALRPNKKEARVHKVTHKA